MEFLTLILVIVTLILIAEMKSNISRHLKRLEAKTNELYRLYRESRPEVTQGEQPPGVPAIEKVDPAVRTQETPPVPHPSAEETGKTVAAPPVNLAPGMKTSGAPRKPGFFERNPDLEKFIGENLVNKIGIGILVIGIGFFVKYAIDQNWINQIGRVFIGILCAAILLGVAHRLRKTFAAFSSVLVGGGIAVLYFTISIAFHEYQLFSAGIAFALMVIITGFGVVLSVAYNRVELAVLAILGGFGSPFMVSTGEGNYIVLFTYMLILNSGMLVLAYYKKWRIVNIVCYVSTVLIFTGWMGRSFERGNASMIVGTLIFATLFYLVFFAMNIVNNLKLKIKFEATEILVLLSNTFLYFLAGMYILNNPDGTDFRGLFTTLLAVFNFAFAYALYKNERADRNLVFMLIGLVITFISLAAPVQLSGNAITLFWAAESVLLLWLSHKSGIKHLALASQVVMGLMVVSLIWDWGNIYAQPDYSHHFAILLNRGYVTGFVAIVSLILTTKFLKRESNETVLTEMYKSGIAIALVAFLYIVHLLELRYQLIYYFPSMATQSVIIGTYNMGFITLLLLATNKLSLPSDVKRALPLFGFFAMASYLIFYHPFVIATRNEYLLGTSGITGFLFHYLLVGLLVVIMLVSLRQFNNDKEFVKTSHNAHWWIYIFVFVFLGSAELDHSVLLAAYSNTDSARTVISQNHKIGYPILWGLSAFLLIYIGLSKRIKMLRIIALALMLGTLLKLFLFDLRDISAGGKIAAFISLGILLLVVSFMYQRLKKLLLDDGEPNEKKTL